MCNKPSLPETKDSSSQSTSPSSTKKRFTDFSKRVPRNFVLFLVLATISLGSLFPLTLKFQGPLLGLGFTESSVLYFDSSPGWSFVLLWLLTIVFFPEKVWSIFRILGAVFVVSSVIYWLVQQAVIVPSDEAALAIVSIPVLVYTTFFSWRLRQYYLQGKLPTKKHRKE